MIDCFMQLVEPPFHTVRVCASLDYKSHSSVEEVAGWHGELCEQCQITGSLMTGDKRDK